MLRTDTQIQKDIIDELQWEPTLDAPSIGVTVKDGVVTLTGVVDSYQKKVLAERAAARISGVKAIAEDIEVRIGIPEKPDDTEIARMVVDALKWNSSLKPEKIVATVEDGWVSLKGEVNWRFQKDSAEALVENLKGINGVSNLITIIPVSLQGNIKEQITDSFRRSATLDSERVLVETRGSIVILSGKVRSLSEKKDAERAAWKAPGVTEVRNDLIVSFG